MHLNFIKSDKKKIISLRRKKKIMKNKRNKKNEMIIRI